MRSKAWELKHARPLTPEDEAQLLRLLQAAAALPALGPDELTQLLRRYPRRGGQFAKDQLVAGYRRLCAEGRLAFDRELLRRLQMKPVRTLSGVATVTVLTKPFPCPGECIFCPTDARMPKSYLADEPGALRAEHHQFDPYATSLSRLRALDNIGHPTDKVELLILGGTWSYYPHDYQAWFIKRCLDALNGVEADSLETAQRLNASAARRNVGLVIETRPDYVDPAEVRRLRGYGVTRVQLGAQSLDDRILELNRRGHTLAQTRQAVRLLRAAGFKIQLHWMPNLLGATPESDREDYRRLWSDPGLRPDELKIYPCALVREAELVRWWERGEYRPYSDEELIDLLADCKLQTPPYVRLNRIVRDIPAGHVVAGSTASNLREVVRERLRARGQACRCVRCREVRGAPAGTPGPVQALEYQTSGGREQFLSVETEAGPPLAIPSTRPAQGGRQLAGFLRLSLPDPDAVGETGIGELAGAALIREVHVYGPMVRLGEAGEGATQHQGLGRRLIEAAGERARAAGYARLAVIAALGTRLYYERQGFTPGELYLFRDT